ncbi:MAG TPA: DUF1579 domain-containing protein [Phycisphaerales bacterium]|nr:DUF1579 domain-containing protein [Phycisphaerales bacterium]
MQIRPISLVHAAIGAGVVGAAVLFAQPATETKPSQPASQPPTAPDHGQPRLEEGMDQQKMMQEWMRLASPGEPHKLLKSLEGEYTTVTRIWMQPGKPQESTGKATFKTILGGRYLQQDFQGTMMNMPMNGLGLMGYDNHRRQYVSMWADSLSTAMYTMTGGISQDGKTITSFGQMDEPTTKQIGKTVKWVTRIVSADKMVFESWEVECGDPMKVFEVEYTRAK